MIAVTVFMGFGGLMIVQALDLGAGYRFGVLFVTGGAVWFVFQLFSKWPRD